MRSTADVILQVASLDDARAFYGKVLGFPVSSPKEDLLEVRTGSSTLYLEAGRLPDPVFEFLVDDVAEAKAELLRQGCKLVEEDRTIPRCYLRDPFGLVFNLGGRSIVSEGVAGRPTSPASGDSTGRIR